MKKGTRKNPHAVSLGRLGGLVRQTAGEPGKWPQGWRGQKPQEGHGGAPQCTPTGSWASEVNRVMMLIRARHGEWAIGRGDSGIRYRVAVQ